MFVLTNYMKIYGVIVAGKTTVHHLNKLEHMPLISRNAFIAASTFDSSSKYTDTINGAKRNLKASTHSYKLSPFFFLNIISIYIYFYARITLRVCHAWFHVYGLRRAVRKG